MTPSQHAEVDDGTSAVTPRSAAVQACLLRVSYNLHVSCKHQQTTKSALGTEAFMCCSPLSLLVYASKQLEFFWFAETRKGEKKGVLGVLKMDCDFTGFPGLIFYSFDQKQRKQARDRRWHLQGDHASFLLFSAEQPPPLLHPTLCPFHY